MFVKVVAKNNLQTCVGEFLEISDIFDKILRVRNPYICKVIVFPPNFVYNSKLEPN